MSEETTATTDSGKNIRPASTIQNADLDEKVLTNLIALAKALEKRAAIFINWYLEKKRVPQALSQWIRFGAIVLSTLGGLCPLLVNVNFSICGVHLFDSAAMHQWGYIFIALAAALVLADRYFGCSNSWMRYMSTQMGLQRTLAKFQLDWAIWRIQLDSKADELTPEQMNSALSLLSAFQNDVSSLMNDEFQSWISDFKEQLSSLQNSIAKSKEEQQPGTIIVMIETATPLSGTRQILLDQQTRSQTGENATVLSAVSPGSHLITVKASDERKNALESSQTVSVSAGQTAVVTIKLSLPPTTNQLPPEAAAPAALNNP